MSVEMNMTRISEAFAGMVAALLLVIVAVTPSQAIEIQEVTSKSGVKAWLVEDYTVPIISMRFAFDGGTTQDPDGKEGLANLMSGLFDEGAGDLDANTFQDRVDVAAAEIGFSAEEDAFSGSIRTLRDTYRDAFGLLALAVNKPSFDQEPLDRIRAQIVSGIKARERQPEVVAAKQWNTAFYGDHSYGREERGSEDTLATVTAYDLRSLHENLFAKANLHVGVVGAISAEELGIILDEVFGELPDEPALKEIPDAEPAFGAKVAVSYPQPQTSLRLAYDGIGRKDPEFFAAYIMNHVLGGGNFSSRLYNEVREKRGLVYGIGSFLSTRDHSNALVISTSTRSDRAAETLGIILDEVKRMAEDGPTAAELEEAKKYILGAYAINNLDNSGSIANTLVGLQQEDLGIDYIDRREELINAVTLEDTKAIAKRLLSQSPAIMVVGPDAEKIAETVN